jgi:hypothetical protein
MPKAFASADVLLTAQVDKVLRRNRAVQRRPVDCSPEAQRISRLLCDELDALVCGDLQPERGSR